MNLGIQEEAEMAQQQMPNIVELYEGTTQHVYSILSGIKQDQAKSPTPCAEWDVRALIDHLVGGAEIASGCLSGTPPDIPFGSSTSSYTEERDLAKLAQIYKELIAKALLVAKSPGALDGRVTTPIDEMPGSMFLGGCCMDNIIHCWDLAKATGQNTRMDPQAVEMSYQMFVPDAMDQGRVAGFIGPLIEIPEESSLQDKLIAYSGRQP